MPLSGLPVTRVEAGPLVVSGARWGLPDGRRGALPAGTSVVAHAATYGVGVVLVLGAPLPDARLYGDLPVQVIGDLDGERGRPWRTRVEVPGAAPVTVVLVERDGGAHGGPWAGLTGTETVTALGVLEHHLGVRWSHSVGRTAESLILATHPRQRGGRRLDRDPQTPGVCVSPMLEWPWMAWQRPLTEAEGGAAWVHTFDANAAYLGPWQTAELGFGVPEHFTTARGCEPRMDAAGCWRVELPAGWAEVPGLPPIAPGLQAADDGGRAGWVMTPTLRRLRQHAEATGQGEVVPTEGYVWPERSRFLRAAGERLRDARADALEAEAAARAALLTSATTEAEAEAWLSRLAVVGAMREAVADLYSVTVGRFSSPRSHLAAAWRRPDWGNTLRAEARANLHRKLSRWQAATGAAPFAVATDALAFATDEPDPAAFAAWLGIPLGDGLGAFHHQGTAPLAEVAGQLGGSARRLGGVFTVARAGLAGS